MNDETLLELAFDQGFANAALIDTEELVFNPAFRPLCEENLCGKYGVNYACPPDCGSPEEMRRQILRWKRAMVFQTIWDVTDPLDEGQTKPAKGKHNKMTRTWIEKAGMPGLMVGASGCNLCEKCAITEGLPCRFPEQKFSCMSAYCVFVRDLAEKCGMEYDCLPNVALFSMYCFEERV